MSITGPSTWSLPPPRREPGPFDALFTGAELDAHARRVERANFHVDAVEKAYSAHNEYRREVCAMEDQSMDCSLAHEREMQLGGAAYEARLHRVGLKRDHATEGKARERELEAKARATAARMRLAAAGGAGRMGTPQGRKGAVQALLRGSRK